jgi:hypothetical protein
MHLREKVKSPQERTMKKRFSTPGRRQAGASESPVRENERVKAFFVPLLRNPIYRALFIIAYLIAFIALFKDVFSARLKNVQDIFRT